MQAASDLLRQLFYYKPVLSFINCIDLYSFFIIFDSMRLLMSLMSVYMLFLTTIPCSDSLARILCDHDNTFTLHMEEIEQNVHSESEQDACSPFCACDCCGIKLSSYSLFLSEWKLLALFYDNYRPPFKNIGHDSWSSIPVWQPPQMDI